MNVVDSSGWIEYLANGENADFFDSPIIDASHLIVPTLCLYEVFKRVLAVLGEERALDAMGLMSQGQVVDLNRQIAIDAARISTELKLALADSVILATARFYEATLWTQDIHFKDIKGVQFVEKRKGK